MIIDLRGAAMSRSRRRAASRSLRRGCRRGRAGPASAAARTPRRRSSTSSSLMQENHSFDNYFGTYPGADGIPAGTCMPIDPTTRDQGCVKPLRTRRRAVAGPRRTTPTVFAPAVQRRADGRLRRRVRPRGRAGSHDRDGLLRRPRHPVLLERRRQLRALRSVLRLGARRQRVEPHVLGHRRARQPGGRRDPRTRASDTDRRSSTGSSERGDLVEVLRPELRPDASPSAARTPATAVAGHWVPLLAYARFLDDPAARSATSSTSTSTTTTCATARCRPSPTSCRPARASTPRAAIRRAQTFVAHARSAR